MAKVAHTGYGGTQCLSRTDPAQAVGGDPWLSLRYGPHSQPYPRAGDTQAMAMWLADPKCAVLLVMNNCEQLQSLLYRCQYWMHMILVPRLVTCFYIR